MTGGASPASGRLVGGETISGCTSASTSWYAAATGSFFLRNAGSFACL
jgi:hypothetical protein